MTSAPGGLVLLGFLSLMNFVGEVPAQDEPPRSLDPRLKIELFAENPQIVTPTGIDVDHAGRVWTIESNTHFPPEGYAGHPSDRILVMEAPNETHKADKITVFKDGLRHTMSIAIKPVWLDIEPANMVRTRSDVKPVSPTPTKPLAAFIATRREILLCTDTDGDLKCDETKQLVRLETKGDYPHNGLAGFAFDALGNMFFGFGENLGADYQIIGSDGTTLSGGGEGGNIYRCQPDGSKLERWATGFWNPHASCFDAFGRMFTVDNDPDSRPPCRLLHIIPGGDYGYRFRNGRKGTHPFTSWNGEIPGTLPMVSGTGEAPSGIVCYESDGFPEDYLGTLLVGSWGDHRIDKFVLKPRGASFESFPQPVIKGGANFRPVGLALAPDGSLYVTDWVLKDYKLHGKGRVWRVSAKEEPKREVIDAATLPDPESAEDIKRGLESRRLDIRRLTAQQAARNPETLSLLEKVLVDPKLDKRGFEAGGVFIGTTFSSAAELRKFPEDYRHQVGATYMLEGDPFLARIAIKYFCTVRMSVERLASWFSGLPIKATGNYDIRKVRQALETATIVLRESHPDSTRLASLAIEHSEPNVRRLAVQWVAEENLKQLRPEVEKVLASEPMTGDLFMACLAALSMLDGVPPAEFEKAPPVQHVLPIVRDAQRSASLRAIALRMLPPTLNELDAKLLGELVASSDDGLRREAVRTLAFSPIPERDALLRPIAADETLDVNLRADAIAGLAPIDSHARFDDATRDLLVKLLSHKNSAIALEALRSTRGAAKFFPLGDPIIAPAPEKILAEFRNGDAPAIKQEFLEAITLAYGMRRENDSVARRFKDLENEPAGDPAAGRRTFFHANSAGCFKCHTVGGRGGQVGPDLTVIARTMDRQKLAESILEPSKEISPQFTTWAIETKSGKVLTGMLLGEEVNGDLRMGDNTGKIFFVPFNDIETRTPMKTSIMPEKLYELMTPSEFRDLVAYLESLKDASRE
jgi:putative membrane-bound dehydrogenase-like protein